MMLFVKKSTIVVLSAVASLALAEKETPGKTNKIIYRSGTEWKAVDTSDIRIRPGSALDQSSFLAEKPAGKHGRVVINRSGRLAFEDNPNISRRFKGFNGFFMNTWMGLKEESDPKNFWTGVASGKPWKKDITRKNTSEYVKLTRLQGYDLIRVHGVESLLVESYEKVRYNPQKAQPYEHCSLNPAMLDDIDWLFGEMKKNGIYAWLPVGAYGLGFRSRFINGQAVLSQWAIGMLLGDKELRTHWKLMVEAMLNHVNPYTGVAWKDEAAILGIEFFNEQALSGILRLQPEKLPARFGRLLDKKWRMWLEKKYRTTANLAGAWKMTSAPESFDAVNVPKSGINGSGPDINDFSIFMRDLAYDNVLWYRDVVRDIGYKGIFSSGFNASKQIFESAVQWQSSLVVCSNNYSGNCGMSPMGRSKINQNNLADEVGGYWRRSNAQRFADRPFMVTEHRFTFWNRYRHQDGLIFGAYSAFQDFSALNVHSFAVKLNDKDGRFKGELRTFPEGHCPIYRANQFLIYCLFRRGDVNTAKHRVQLDIPLSFLKSGCNGNLAVNDSQSKIAVLTGFSIAFPQLPIPAGINPDIRKADISILPNNGAVVKSSDWESSVAGDNAGKDFSLSEFCKKLRKKGILDRNNISNPDQGIFQNENGELTIRSQEKLIKVVTAKTEAVALENGKSEALGNLTVNSTSIPACIAMCAIDENSLKSSKRIVLVYSTEAVNSGMEISSDSLTMYKLGSLPILMRCGKLSLNIKNVNATRMSLYALRLNGTRAQKIPVKSDNNSIDISFDTASLPEGPTPFFELTAE